LYQERSGPEGNENIPAPTDNRTPAIQPVASHLAVNGEAGGVLGTRLLRIYSYGRFFTGDNSAWKQVFGRLEFLLLLPLQQVRKLKVHAFTYTKQKSLIHIGKLS
jgi:hypothetical protein